MDKDNISSFLLGLGVGIGIGLLFAPQSGQETRQLIKRKTGEGSDFLKQKSVDLKDAASGWVEKGKDAVSRQKDTISEAVEAGRQAYREAVNRSEAAAEGAE
jgi:gas vesicle protein